MQNEQIRVKVSSKLKKDFQEFCKLNDKDMSKVIRRLIIKHMGEENGGNISDNK